MRIRSGGIARKGQVIGNPGTPTPPPPTGQSINIALYCTASASSYYDSVTTTIGQNPGRYLPDFAINGDRKGKNWGNYDLEGGTGAFHAEYTNGSGWNSNPTNVFPQDYDLLMPADQAGDPVAQSINRLDVFCVQDNYQSPVEPTPEMTGSAFLIVDFDIQYWNGSAYVTVASVRSNNLIWRPTTFPTVTTTKLRIHVIAALGSYARLAEVEAWTDGAPNPFAPKLVVNKPPSGSIILGQNVPIDAVARGLNVTGVTFKRNGSAIYTSASRTDEHYTYTDDSPPADNYTYRIEVATSNGMDVAVDRVVAVVAADVPPQSYPTTGSSNFVNRTSVGHKIQALPLIDPGPDDINLVAVTLLNETNWNGGPNWYRRGVDASPANGSIPEASGTGLRFYKPNDQYGGHGGDWFNSVTDSSGNPVRLINPGDQMTMQVEMFYNGVTLNTLYRFPDGGISSGKFYDWNASFNQANNYRATTSSDSKIVTSRWKGQRYPIVYRYGFDVFGNPNGADEQVETVFGGGFLHDVQPRYDQDGTKTGFDRVLYPRDNRDFEDAGRYFDVPRGARGVVWPEPCHHQSRLKIIRRAPEKGTNIYLVEYILRAGRYNQPSEVVIEAQFFLFIHPSSGGMGTHFLFDFYTGVQSEASGSPHRADGAFMEYRNYAVGTDWFADPVYVSAATFVGAGTVGYGWDDIPNSAPSAFQSALKAPWDTSNITYHGEIFKGSFAGSSIDQLLDEVFKSCDGGHAATAQNGIYGGSLTGAGWRLLQTSTFLAYRQWPLAESENEKRRNFFADGRPIGDHNQDSHMVLHLRDGTRIILQPAMFRAGYLAPGPQQPHATSIIRPDRGGGLADVGEKYDVAVMDPVNIGLAIPNSNGCNWLPSDFQRQTSYCAFAPDYKRGKGMGWLTAGQILEFEPMPSLGQPGWTQLTDLGEAWTGGNCASCVDIIRDRFVTVNLPTNVSTGGAGIKWINVKTLETGFASFTINNPMGLSLWQFLEAGTHNGALVHDWVVDELHHFHSEIFGNGTWGSIKMADFDAGSRVFEIRGEIPPIATIAGNVHFAPRQRGLVRIDTYDTNMKRGKRF